MKLQRKLVEGDDRDEDSVTARQEVIDLELWKLNGDGGDSLRW